MVPFLISAVCGIAPLLFAGRRYNLPIRGFTAAIFIWSIAVAMRISATTVATEAIWHNFRMLGPSIAAASFFLFAARYTDRGGWLERRQLALLSVIPAITIVAGLTNQYHGLLRSSVTVVAGGPYVMSYTPGTWYFIHAGYSYSLVAISIFWLMTNSVIEEVKSEQQRQRVVVLVSSMLVLTTNLAFNIDLTVIDWTPVAGGVWATMTVIVARRYRIFGLTPLARKAVVKELSQGVITVDQDCEIIDMNPAANRLLGKSSTELIGNNIQTAFNSFNQDVEQFVRSNEDVERIETTDGRYFSVSIGNITNSAGELLGKTVTFRDVTDRVTRQQQLEEQKVELEAKHKEVEAQKEELRDQNEKLEQFAEVVTHDLRNPLNVINGHTTILQDQGTEENPHLNGIEETANEMEQLIDELLELSRLGDTIQSVDNIDIDEMATRAWSNVNLPQCDLNVDVPTGSEIVASRTELCRVFENLYRNAGEHNEGDLEISVGLLTDKTGDVPADACQRGIYIEDTGKGVPDPIKDDIFNRGYTSNDNGTGFGLAIVSEIVEAHGWDINVTNGEEGGARFEISGAEIATKPEATVN